MSLLRASAHDPVQHKMIEEATPDVLNAKGLLMFLKRNSDDDSPPDAAALHAAVAAAAQAQAQ
jgi:hypothetical protein